MPQCLTWLSHAYVQANRNARRADNDEKKRKLAQSLVDGPRLVIDLDFEEQMTPNDIRHLSQQVRTHKCWRGVHGRHLAGDRSQV